MPRTDQGAVEGRYMVIPRTLIFVTRGEEVLLLRGGPHKRLWANLYNGVGGHIERGEDALSGARRELLEETGLMVADLRLRGTVFVDADEKIGISIYVFQGEFSGGEPVASGEGTLEWVALNQLDDFPLVEDLKMLLPRVLAARSSGVAFSAITTYDEADRLVMRFG